MHAHRHLGISWNEVIRSFDSVTQLGGRECAGAKHLEPALIERGQREPGEELPKVGMEELADVDRSLGHGRFSNRFAIGVALG
jgi:hypothetical protein